MNISAKKILPTRAQGRFRTGAVVWLHTLFRLDHTTKASRDFLKPLKEMKTPLPSSPPPSCCCFPHCAKGGGSMGKAAMGMGRQIYFLTPAPGGWTEWGELLPHLAVAAVPIPR